GQGKSVVARTTLLLGAPGLLPAAQHRGSFELIKGDVCDEAAVRKPLDGADAVVPLAAVVGYPACKKEPHVAQATNVEGTRTLLRMRKRDQRIAFASTGSIYGSVPDYICNEKTPRAPITLYGETKAEAEQLILD